MTMVHPMGLTMGSGIQSEAVECYVEMSDLAKTIERFIAMTGKRNDSVSSSMTWHEGDMGE